MAGLEEWSSPAGPRREASEGGNRIRLTAHCDLSIHIYYRDYHAFWKLNGIGLPDPVLKKLYNGSALKLTRRLRTTV
jgi:hypothetical protein